MIRTITTKFGFVRTALAVGVAIPFLAGSSAFAQAPPPATNLLDKQGAIARRNRQSARRDGGDTSRRRPGATAETERIIVTGSYIPTAQEVGPNPVLNINRDLINKSGERTAEELIKDLPVANGGGVPISNNGTGFTPGASAISLRGLGPQETLVLINGRRVAPYPIGNGGTSSFFDLRSIPEAAIESIEVLKDGASTTYGADAVAGVVNIKLRQDYKGVQAQIGYGNTMDKDSGEVRANVVFGVGDGNTNVSGVINYYNRNSIFNRDRSYSAVPPFLSTNSTPENLSLTYDQVVAAGGTPPAGFGPVGNVEGLPSIFFGHAPFGSNGNFAGVGLHLFRCLVSPSSISTNSRALIRSLKIRWVCDLRSQRLRRCDGRLRRLVLPERRPRTTNWRLPPPARFRRPARSLWPFRRKQI